MSCPSNTKPKLVSMAAGILVILVAMFAGVETASAQTCIEDKVEAAYGSNAVPLNCTAEDVRLGLFNAVGGPIECAPGDLVTATLEAQLVAGAKERYDIGMFINLDGEDAFRGNCYHDYLPPPLSPDLTPAGADRYPPFYNAEASEDPGDTCVDLEQAVTPPAPGHHKCPRDPR